MKKRLLSILLMLCMVFALLPVAVLAEGEESLCICTEACTDEHMDEDCPVCGAEGAAAEVCALYTEEQPIEEDKAPAEEPVEGGEDTEEVNESGEEQSKEDTEEANAPAVQSVDAESAAAQSADAASPIAVQAAGHDHCICGGSVSAGDHTGHSDVTYQAWNGSGGISYSNKKAYVYLTGNATMNSDLIVDGNTLYLCLNGKELASNGSKKIKVRNNGHLVLCDCRGGGSIKGVKSGWGGSCIYIYNSKLDIFGGKLTGGKVKYGGAVCADDKNCVINMYGGEISGNTATGKFDANKPSAGGAIFMNDGSGGSGKLNLYGGTISGNTAQYDGGAISFQKGGTLNISGGVIKNNKAQRGGAIHMKGGTVTMSGGTLSGNKATNDGGGVYLKNGATLNLKGASITGNTAEIDGGGVYAKSSSTKVTLSDNGVISENEAKMFGGGINLEDGATLEMKGGEIRSNKSDSASKTNGGGGGISAWNGAKITMYGGTVSGNTVTCTAGGVGGGGIEVHNAELTMSGGTITKNGAAVNGGAILAIQDDDSKAETKVTITGGTISENAAEYAAIYAVAYNTKRCVLNVNGGEVKITGNRSADNGSAIHIRKGCDVTLGTAKITGNTATNGNGAVYLAEDVNGTVKLTGKLIIQDNTGGNLYLKKGKTFTPDSLSVGANIGVSTEENPNVVISTAENTDYSSYFFSDAGKKIIYNSNKQLEITKAAACQHTGGTADCQNRAVCEKCGTAYGNIAPDNHAKNCVLTWTRTETKHMQKYSGCGKLVVPEENHNWKNGVCTKCGYACKHRGGSASCFEQAICEICGEKYGSLAEHNFVDQINESRLVSAANCKSPAVYYKSCSVCDAQGTETFMSGEKNADNHVGGTEVRGAKSATCTEGGYTGDTYCLGCDKMIGQGTATGALGHTGGTATCIAKARCDTCGEEYGAIDPDRHAGNQKWYTTEKTHEHKWDCCGSIIVNEGPHQWKDGECVQCGYECRHTGGRATCMEKAVCEECGMAYGDFGDHDFDMTQWGYKGQDGHAHNCQTSGCGEHDDVTAHTPDRPEATEEDPVLCTECGYQIQAALGHTHKLTKVDRVEPTCTEDGNKEYYVCRCGDWFEDENAETRITDPDSVILKATGHSYPDTWKADAENHWKECACGDKTQNAAHSFKWVTDKNATSTEKGTKHRECSVCGYKEAAVEMPAAGTPAKPDGGKTNSGKADGGKTDKSPKTGDENAVTVWLGIFALSSAAGAAAIISVKKSKNNGR